MLNEVTEATVLTAAIFVALLSEHVTIAVMCGMALIYVLMKSMVEPNEADKKAAGVGDTDDSDK
ncbi:hypothetical protein PS395_08765 [Limosilactobacillus pontis]|uniref:hypothetical protein n=1 Tax=Limosilactobacillus pontis TaxID=35787 RepID=UPI002F26BD4D